MTATATAPEPAVSAPSSAGRRRPSARALAAVAVGLFVLVAAGIVALVAVGGGSASQPYRYQVVVPDGTSKRIAAGYHIELLPASVPLKVGDHLVVRNLDQQVAVVGPFSVRPGETLDHVFTAPGTFEGVCAVGGSTAHSVKIVVT